MGGHQFPFWKADILPLPVNVLNNGYRGRELAQLANIFEVLIHLLIADDRKGQPIEVERGILVQNSLGHFIDRDVDGIIRLDGGQPDIPILDVCPLQLGQIRITQRGEAAETE